MHRLNDSWIWDSWFAFDGEYHHAFYLRASRALGNPDRRHRYPFVGHARSKDLVNWEVLPDAVAVSDQPAFDDWTTWTGSVVRDESGLWWMFYTGSSRGDGGDVQRVGAATSADLITWEKVSSDAIVEADGRYYELLDKSLWHDQAWRDPWVFKHEGRWHMFITARTNEGDRWVRGVVGHAVSDDLRTWEVLPPLTEPGGFGQMEVFQVAVIDGTPTLLWCCGYNELSDPLKQRFGAGGMFSVTGETLLGPFDISQATRFPHPSIYAARVIEHQGQWFMIGFRDMEDGRFVGELTDPIPVTAIPGKGLQPR